MAKKRKLNLVILKVPDKELKESANRLDNEVIKKLFIPSNTHLSHNSDHNDDWFADAGYLENTENDENRLLKESHNVLQNTEACLTGILFLIYFI